MDFPGVDVLDVFIVLFVVIVVLRGARTGFLAGVFSLVGVVVGASVGSRFALSLVLVWAVGVFALQSQPLAGLHPAVQNSRILQSLNERMPSGLLTRAVANLEPLPQIRGPEPEVAAPEGSILKDPDVRAASARTLRVTGIACGYGVEGSGWIAGQNLVVTNAHVVAGESATRVQVGGAGELLPAKVVVFDEKNDIAVLRVDRLGLTPLRLATPQPGEPAAVIGFPENGPLDIEPARTGTTQRVVSSDAYDRGPVERTVTSFRVYVRPGNSGGPAVNAKGQVVSTIFASRTDSDNSGYGIPSRIVHRYLQAAASRTIPVSTGGCAN